VRKAFRCCRIKRTPNIPSVSTDKHPAEIDKKLSSLEQTLTKNRTFQNSIEQMDDLEVEHAIDEIVGLFSIVARAYPEI